jgi:hypothetical protein
MSQLPCQVMHLKSASVVQAAGDNSCLYHSLSYDLNHEEMYSNVYDENNDGFTLRHLVNDYIRDNLFKYIWTSPDICEIFACWQDTTEQQRVYNGGIKRSYSLKVTGKNQGSNNLPPLLQALPDKIEWPSYPYYKVAGHHLQQPKDWPLP